MDKQDAAAATEDTSSRMSGPQPSYAFLVHSQDSLGQNAAPEVDNRRLARQKRRRTSPEDHAILEAEYERNPKPDKATRQELVKRVALGEKEVQIWFQNRRQMARRKSRPADEASTLDDEPPGKLIAYGGVGRPTVLTEHWFSSSQSNHGPSSDPSSSQASNRRSGGKASNSPGSSEDGNVLFQLTTKSGRVLFETSAPTRKSSSNTSRPGSLANRRSASFIVNEQGKHASTSTHTASKDGNWDGAPLAKPLRRTMSMVKLTMDEDGKADVTKRTGETPSPAKPEPAAVAKLHPGRAGTLQRSYSAIEGRSHHSLDLDFPPLRPRQPPGRSRDSRTWEFYCDSSARDELTKQAEREESGSAVAAIGLIKSQSKESRKLALNSNKRNALAHKSSFAKRPKFAKNKTQERKEKVAGDAKQPIAIYEDVNGDSDKENWQPGTRVRRPSPVRSRSAISQGSARVLLESLREPSESASLEAALSRPSKSTPRIRNSSSSESKENGAPQVDAEVASFMDERGAAQDDEMDCVQNLLRLSQAAWN